MHVRGRDNDDVSPCRLAGENAHGRVFEHQTVGSLQTQFAGSQQITIRIGLAGIDILSRHHDGRKGNAGCLHAPERQVFWRGRHDRPFFRRQRLQKMHGAGYFDGTLDIIDFRLRHGYRFGDRVNTGQPQARNRIDGPRTMDGRDKDEDIQAVTSRPCAPDSFSGAMVSSVLSGRVYLWMVHEERILLGEGDFYLLTTGRLFHAASNPAFVSGDGLATARSKRGADGVAR